MDPINLSFFTALGIGTALVVLCVFVQAYGLQCIKHIHTYIASDTPKPNFLISVVIRIFHIHKNRVDLLILAILTIHTVQVWGWAVFYYQVNLFPNFETALYFSATTFSTLGYGDILLPTGWRLTATLEAISGLLFIGWSTAFIFATLQKKQ